MAQLPWLHPTHPSFPPVNSALDDPNGLLAVGGDLSVARLTLAYQLGIFPWFEDGQPILWWSPDPRMVLTPGEVHIARSLKKTIRKDYFKVTFDKAFGEVISACSEPREKQRGTWITAEMQQAYYNFHESGYAHSVEVWIEDQLVGGLYGVAMGSVFFGESMFSRENDASKVALIALCKRLQDWNFELIDCQMETPHLISMGAKSIPRENFTKLLANATCNKSSRHFCAGKWLTPFNLLEHCD